MIYSKLEGQGRRGAQSQFGTSRPPPPACSSETRTKDCAELAQKPHRGPVCEPASRPRTAERPVRHECVNGTHFKPLRKSRSLIGAARRSAQKGSRWRSRGSSYSHGCRSMVVFQQGKMQLHSLGGRKCLAAARRGRVGAARAAADAEGSNKAPLRR